MADIELIKKIDATHDAVLTLVAEFKGFKELSDTKHMNLNEKVESIEHVVNGNGKPGLISNLNDLEKRFNKAEAKFITFGTIIMALVTFLTPKIYDWIGWANH